MTEIVSFPKEKVVSYPQEQELLNRMLGVIYEYAGDISLASVLGVLELTKDELMRQHE